MRPANLYFTLALLIGSPLVSASDYIIDTKGSHAFIQFRIPHLGYSWLLGRFNTFSGHFSFDMATPSKAQVAVSIETKSIDTNHAERDNHLRGEDFLDVGRFPTAHFISSKYETTATGNGKLHGNLTLRGVTRPVSINVRQIGAGMDPWGGYRRGFEGTTLLRLRDFGIDFDLGPDSELVQLELYVEGIRKKSRQRRLKR